MGFIRKVGGVFAALILTAGVFVASSENAAAAKVKVRVDRGSQTMRVYVGGHLRHSWRVSTGRKGYTTPRGSYRPTRMYRRYFSRKYYNSPMPFSIFFRGGYAIHGTTHIRNLGRRASHGCIRLAPGNAARLYSLVKRYGSRNTRIIIR